jgi:hypothetical protein
MTIKLGIFIVTLISVSWVPFFVTSSQGFINSDPDPRKAPTAVSGDNIYVAWSSNKTGNEEVMFMVSNDSGKTFSDKINLSNSTAHSDRIEIAVDGKNVIVTWWETDESEENPAAKVSNDFGKTFGPLLELGVNGTIGTGEAKPIL